MSDTYRALREEVYRANMELAESGLVTGTFGNLSAVDRAAGVFAIKPSGVRYEHLSPEHIVVVSLASGAPTTASPTPFRKPRRLSAADGMSPPWQFSIRRHDGVGRG